MYVCCIARISSLPVIDGAFLVWSGGGAVVMGWSGCTPSFTIFLQIYKLMESNGF